MSSPEPAPVSIIHHVNLALYGGLQTHFLRFVNASSARFGYRNSAWLETEDVHAEARRSKAFSALSVCGSTKYARGIKLPGWPGFIRERRLDYLFRKASPNIGLIWDGFNRTRITRELQAQKATPIYWEHGASWYSHHKSDKTAAFWSSLESVLCNSKAAKRMLELRWNCPLPVHVCLNGIASDTRTTPGQVRQFPTMRRVRLGTAGHLRTYKGGHIAISALAALRRRGVDAELWLAGVGPKYDELLALAEALGVADVTVFKGFVSNMQHDFFDQIDLFVHPAMREAFGLVCAEAMLAGCPVVATHVDGLPEVVTHGHTGRCIVPVMPPSALAKLHTELETRVNCVYDPITDQVCEPHFVDPETLADTIAVLLSEDGELERLSRNSLEEAHNRLSFERHLDDVQKALAPFS